jgi:diguanylate cyclase (GGDEF)-like protein
MLVNQLHDILVENKLTSWFQPIVNLKTAEILGYEALVRGPSNSPLHAPEMLFAVAEECGRLEELENACLSSHLKSFIDLQLKGSVFLNVSPQSLASPRRSPELTKRFLAKMGLSPDRVVIELTEHRPVDNSQELCAAVVTYRKMGFGVAIDDLGAGYNGLKLWSEVRPDYVKVDRHFIQGIDDDYGKRELLISLLEMARGLGCWVIAEGIETAEEYRVVKEVGAPIGQGYFFARPSPMPVRNLPAGMLIPADGNCHGSSYGRARSTKVASLVKLAPTISPMASVQATGDLMAECGNLRSLPVVKDGVPVGIVHRHELLQLLASRFGRDLHGRAPISQFMDSRPLIVEKDMPVEKLSHLITDEAELHAVQDFLVTDQGRYLGVGTLIDLLREVTELQIRHARYANPLTMLPGNVPINEHIDFLLQNGENFVTCYFDLDQFKPFNDHYGYGRGDMVLRLLARILVNQADCEQDFVGHIGGDDFIVIFQNPNWEGLCRTILAQFDSEAPTLYDPIERAAGGIRSTDRKGQPQFFPLVSLSVGAVRSSHGYYRSSHDIAIAASEAKCQAKKLTGSQLFVERRFYDVDVQEMSDSA